MEKRKIVKFCEMIIEYAEDIIEHLETETSFSVYDVKVKSEEILKDPLKSVNLDDMIRVVLDMKISEWKSLRNHFIEVK